MGGYEQQSAGLAQKPRTVSRREEVRQRVERGDWHGSEIGKQHKFLLQSAGQARTLNVRGGGCPLVDGIWVPCTGMG